MLHLNKENFDETIASGTVLVDFWASWCGPCKMIAPIVEEIAAERPDITVGKVNVDEEMDLARRFGIASIPTILVFKNGELSKTSIGYCSKEELLSLLLKKFPVPPIRTAPIFLFDAHVGAAGGGILQAPGNAVVPVDDRPQKPGGHVHGTHVSVHFP